MRTLAECLRDRDAGFLQIVAELWGIDLPSGPANQAASALAGMLSQSPWLEECISSLPAQAREALDHLLQQGGRTPMADFERRYGPLRAMGPGKRDRQKPWRNPASATEALWYRALIDRAFFDTPKGPQEFAYIPEDLHAALQPHTTSPKAPLGQACPPPARPALADSRIVDDATTLLAALRARPAAQESLPLSAWRRCDLISTILKRWICCLPCFWKLGCSSQSRSSRLPRRRPRSSKRQMAKRSRAS